MRNKLKRAKLGRALVSNHWFFLLYFATMWFCFCEIKLFVNGFLRIISSDTLSSLLLGAVAAFGSPLSPSPRLSAEMSYCPHLLHCFLGNSPHPATGRCGGLVSSFHLDSDNSEGPSAFQNGPTKSTETCIVSAIPSPSHLTPRLLLLPKVLPHKLPIHKSLLQSISHGTETES